MEKREVLRLLRDEPWEKLREKAENTLLRTKGRHVFARGLVEFSSICQRNCLYCGLGRQNRKALRYRLEIPEILAAAQKAASHGADTIVLQSGEGAADAGWLAEVIGEIRDRLGLPITLSVGECDIKDYQLWHRAGAKRFLLRHETANVDLYRRLHPGYSLENRLRCLKALKETGYETGGGFIVGLPWQSLEILADDILLTRDLQVDMCGVGPFIPQQDSPLANFPAGSPQLTLRVIAILRLLMPNANLPATTALASLDPATGQTDGLRAGANVLMPSFTPEKCAEAYKIYDNKHSVAVEEAIRAIEGAGREHNLSKIPRRGH